MEQVGGAGTEHLGRGIVLALSWSSSRFDKGKCAAINW